MSKKQLPKHPLNQNQRSNQNKMVNQNLIQLPEALGACFFIYIPVTDFLLIFEGSEKTKKRKNES